MNSSAERVVTSAASVGAAAIDVLYLQLIRAQGGPDSADVLTVPFVASYLALMAVLLALSVFAPSAARPVLRAAASAGLLVLAVLSGFSIGAAVLVAAALAIVSFVFATRAASSGRVLGSAAASAAVSVAVLLAGFQVSWHYLVCPPSGEMGGTTAGFFGQVTYECNNGRLTYR